MPSGRVKWFDKKKGYGFIIPDDGGSDVFVHYTGIDGEGFRILQENQTVEYELTDGRRGKIATKVKIAD